MSYEPYEFREGGRIKRRREKTAKIQGRKQRMTLTTQLATAKLDNIATIGDYLIENQGNLTKVALALDVPRHLLDAKIKRTPSLQQIMKNFDAMSVDAAREAIDALVEQRNVTAVTFVLKTLGGGKYNEKVTVEHELGANTTAGIIAAMKKAEADGGLQEDDGDFITLEDEDD